MATFSLTENAKASLPPRLLLGLWCIVNHTDFQTLARDLDYSAVQLSRFWRKRTPKLATTLQRRTGLSLPASAWSRTPPTITSLSEILRLEKATLTRDDLRVARDAWLLLRDLDHDQFSAEVDIPKDSLRRILVGDHPYYHLDPEQQHRLLSYLGLGSSVQLSLF